MRPQPVNATTRSSFLSSQNSRGCLLSLPFFPYLPYLRLDASASYDPDGDNLSFLWFQYPEAGSYKQEIKLGPPENANRIYGKAPEVEKEESIHLILRVTDKGEPQLSRYQRIILTVAPKYEFRAKLANHP